MSNSMALRDLKTAAQSNVFERYFVLLFFFVLFLITLVSTSTVFADNLIPAEILEKIESKKLYNTQQWKRLLHYKKGKSEIDDPTFFLSKEGKTNLESELKASILKLINDKTDNKKSTLCYYPSRSNWILQQLPSLKSIIKTPKCEALNKELESLDVKRVTLILASAHINSPASAFGHTFLRLDSSDDTVLASYSVNYAAITAETNGFIYAYQGLFGGYQGRYSVEPYSKMLETYSDLEQRDVWEYPLELTPAEINRMVLHILEIRNFYADYFFLSENCSYNLLWLLEVAKDDVDLTNQFGFKAIPIDTLRAVEKSGLIKDIVYRPSKRRKILTKSKTISHVPEAIGFAKSNEYDLEQLNGLSVEHKAKALELGSHLLQTKYNKKEISKKKYLGNFIKLLKERSKLGDVPEREIEKPTIPEKGHNSNKVSLSFDSDNRAGIRFKVAYHDIYDNESGFIPGSYINFFDTSIKVKSDKVSLEEINLLDIRSYAIQDAIFKPVSWQVSLGAKRVLNNELDPYFQVGAGVTIGHEKLFSYLTLAPSLYYNKEDNKQSISANAGLIYNSSSSLKMGLLGRNEWFKGSQEILKLEPFVTYNMTKHTALNLRYSHEALNGSDKTDEATLSIFWYF